MKENPPGYGADEQELAAITREIHAQLRALYEGSPAERVPPRRALRPRAAADIARFVAVFLLPPLAMIALGLVLKLVRDGF